MVITDMINIAKDTILTGFEWINDHFFYDILTKWAREFPEDPIPTDGWGSYALFLFVMFLIPCGCGMCCHSMHNFIICCCTLCYCGCFWSLPVVRWHCMCQIIAEFFMILVLVGGAVVVIIFVFVYFDFYQMEMVIFDMAYNHMNTTKIEFTDAIDLTEDSGHTFIILGLISFAILYNLYACVTISHIFCGFSCVCGSTFWWHYCGACMTYFGVLYYTLLGGLFFCCWFFVQDFCRFDYIMWPNMQRILHTWVDIEPFATFTGQMVEHCITDTREMSKNLYCTPFFEGWEKYICRDANWFINIGMLLVSLYMALMFFLMFFAVCYVGNSVRGDRVMVKLDKRKRKAVKKTKMEAKRLENYYLELGADGLNNEDEVEDGVVGM